MAVIHLAGCDLVAYADHARLHVEPLAIEKILLL
jgi:hypothetical protein